MRSFNRLPILPVTIALLFCGACNSNAPSKPAESSALAAAAPAAQQQGQQPAEVNACSFLNAADAQSVMGAAMQPSPGTRRPSVCMYQEAVERPNSMGPGRLSLTVNEAKSADEENRHWVGLKEVRHLEPGQKNTQVLSGLGDEAYFTGNTQKGKVGVAGVIVRKGRSDFELDCMVLDYVASPEAMKSIAKRIVGQLP